MIIRLISSVRSTPYSSFKSSGNSKAIKSSSSQCGYQMGKSVPHMIRSGPIQKSRLAMISAKWRGVLWTKKVFTTGGTDTIGERSGNQRQNSRRGEDPSAEQKM